MHPWEQNIRPLLGFTQTMQFSVQAMDQPAKLQEELEGYCGLGMYDEALRRISQARRKGDHSLTLDFLRTRILRAAGRFVELRKTAEQLRRQRPDEPEVWVSVADAVRHQDSLQQGRTILLEAERKFPNNPHIKFQLGCYHCQLRDMDKARSYLQAAIRIDESWASVAKEDADLAPLREVS
jgi:tetratricopeptide (TPR) repeat protein